MTLPLDGINDQAVHESFHNYFYYPRPLSPDSGDEATILDPGLYPISSAERARCLESAVASPVSDRDQIFTREDYRRTYLRACGEAAGAHQK